MCSVLCDTTMNEGLGITPNVGPRGATLAPPNTATCTCHPGDAPVKVCLISARQDDILLSYFFNSFGVSLVHIRIICERMLRPLLR